MPFEVVFEDNSQADEPIQSWEWNFGTGATDNNQNTTYTYSESGIYEASLTIFDGFQYDTSFFEIIVFAPIDMELVVSDDEVCEGTSINLTAQTNGACNGCTYQWSSGQTSANFDIVLNENSDFTVTVTSSEGCESVSNIFITTLPVPNIEISSSNLMPCSGDIVELNLNLSAAQNAEWSTGETTSMIQIQESGSYEVIVVNMEGCTGMDVIEVSFIEEINASLNVSAAEVCQGEEVILTANGGSSYQWLDSSNTIEYLSDSQVAAILSEDLIVGVIASNNCFADTLYENISVYPNLVNTSNDTIVVIGAEVAFVVEGGIGFWEGSVDFSCIECPITSFQPDSTTTVFVTIIDEFGCTSEDSIYIEVRDNLIDLFDPINIISPNDDGFNDQLEFKGLLAYPRNSLKVFNRWGNIVYDAVGYQNDWTGTYKGQPLPAGNYYYILSINSNEQIIKSVLSIVRD